MFAAAGRHRIVGIAASFAGVSGGFSANLLPGQFDALLLGISEVAAQLLAPDWKMTVTGNWHFIAAMLPYSWFLVAGLAMTVGWVFLDLPVGPGASVDYVLPGLR